MAARLSPGGVFVVEAFVPDMCRYDDSGQSLHEPDGEHMATARSSGTRLVSIDGEPPRVPDRDPLRSWT